MELGCERLENELTTTGLQHEETLEKALRSSSFCHVSQPLELQGSRLLCVNGIHTGQIEAGKLVVVRKAEANLIDILPIAQMQALLFMQSKLVFDVLGVGTIGGRRLLRDDAAACFAKPKSASLFLERWDEVLASPVGRFSPYAARVFLTPAQSLGPRPLRILSTWPQAFFLRPPLAITMT